MDGAKNARRFHRDQTKNGKPFYVRLFMICENDRRGEFSINKTRETFITAEHFTHFHIHVCLCPPILFDVHFNIDCYLVAIKRVSHQSSVATTMCEHIRDAPTNIRVRLQQFVTAIRFESIGDGGNTCGCLARTLKCASRMLYVSI